MEAGAHARSGDSRLAHIVPVRGNLIGLGGNSIISNEACHTSGFMLLMETNAIYLSSAPSCPALPGN